MKDFQRVVELLPKISINQIIALIKENLSNFVGETDFLTHCVGTFARVGEIHLRSFIRLKTSFFCGKNIRLL